MKKLLLIFLLLMSGCVLKTTYTHNADGTVTKTIEQSPLVVIESQPVYRRVWVPDVWVIDIRGSRHLRRGHYERHRR